jgi:hypothetical protein
MQTVKRLTNFNLCDLNDYKSDSIYFRDIHIHCGKAIFYSLYQKYS